MSKKAKCLLAAAIIFAAGAVVVMFVLSHNTGEMKKDTDYTYLTNMQADSDDSQSYWATNGHNFAKAEGGYYFLNELGNSLMFFDADTKEIIPVCGKPECQHNDKDCNAYLGRGSHLLGSIYYYQGYIYLFKLSNGNAAVEQIEPDGSSRRVIAEVMPNDGTTSLYMAFHNGCAYVYDHTAHIHSDEEHTECIKEVSLETGEVHNIYEITGINMAIDNAKSFGGKLFFVVEQGCKNEDTGIIALKGQGLFAYDYDTKQVYCINESDIYDYYMDIENNNLYYYINGEGLYKADINTMESSLIYQASKEMDMCQISYDGKYVYLNNMRWSTYKNTPRKNAKCIVINPNGEIVNEIPCSGFLHIYYGDSEYMFALKPGEGAMNGLVYIDKSNIETIKEWTQISKSEIEIYSGRGSD